MHFVFKYENRITKPDEIVLRSRVKGTREKDGKGEPN
jgi:hypothetical protein